MSIQSLVQFIHSVRHRGVRTLTWPVIITVTSVTLRYTIEANDNCRGCVNYGIESIGWVPLAWHVYVHHMYNSGIQLHACSYSI